MKRALAGLRMYQEAPRASAVPLQPALACIHGATLRDYGGSGPPLLFVPSLINPPNVLDLTPERSLLRWLAQRGHRVLLLDWGWDVASRRNMSVADHVERILVPFVRELDEPPVLVGYCLGGTMTIPAASLAKVRGLVTIAAPWHFSRFSDEARAMLAELWTRSQTTVRALGMLPMEVLQTAFWSLDPGRTVGKFEAFADMPLESPEARSFVTLEDWSNDGPPLPEAAAREMFESFFRDNLPGKGKWRVAETVPDPKALPCPVLNVVSTSDRIVPQPSAPEGGERMELAQGHVGMIVGGRGREVLWEPLHAWLSQFRAT